MLTIPLILRESKSNKDLVDSWIEILTRLKELITQLKLQFYNSLSFTLIFLEEEEDLYSVLELLKSRSGTLNEQEFAVFSYDILQIQILKWKEICTISTNYKGIIKLLKIKASDQILTNSLNK